MRLAGFVFASATLLVPAVPHAALAAVSPADSAAAARVAWREARDASFLGDRVGAMLKAERAHSAWPMQWYYAFGLATLAAKAGEPSTTARALDDLAAIGVGMDLSADTTLMALARANISVRTSLDRVNANRAPLARSTTLVAFTLADSAFFPEGLALDPKTGRRFVASVRGRKIAVIEKGKAPRDFVTQGLWGALAVAVDAPRGRLWATSAAIPQMGEIANGDSGRAAIHAFDLATGKPIGRFELPRVPEGHIPGDVCVAPNGDVYVTDSTHPAIYRVRAGAADGTAPEEWLAHPSFRSLQGQAIAPDGKTLYVADYTHGIAGIDLASKTLWWIPSPAGTSVLGIDGMALFDGDLIAIQNGLAPARVVRLTLGRATPKAPATQITAVEVLDRNVPLADDPTMGVVDGERFDYVANSQWEKYDDSGARRPGIPLTSPRLLTLDLMKKR
jgi:DNA-binding beta-propeller fold protein YncE